MADLNAIRAGLAANLATVTAINVAQEFPDQLVPPQAVIGLPEDGLDYHFTVGTTGLTTVLPVFLYMQRTAIRPAQRLLMDFLSTGVANSIPDAINSDRTLGGTIDSLAILSVDLEGDYTVAGNDYLGAKIRVEVIASA